MSTGNFYKGNASHYFAFGMNCRYTEEDVQEMGLDESMVGEYDEETTNLCFEDDLGCVKGELERKGWSDCDGYSGDRDYGMSYIAEKGVNVVFHGVEYVVTIKAGYRCGYYEGANFDWDLNIKEYCTNVYNGVYDEVPSLSDIVGAFECRNGRPRKNTEETEYLQARQLEMMLDDAIEVLIGEVEDVFECYSTKLCVSVRFDNGETWYEKAE